MCKSIDINIYIHIYVCVCAALLLTCIDVVRPNRLADQGGRDSSLCGGKLHPFLQAVLPFSYVQLHPAHIEHQKALERTNPSRKDRERGKERKRERGSCGKSRTIGNPLGETEYSRKIVLVRENSNHPTGKWLLGYIDRQKVEGEKRACVISGICS